MQLENQLQTTIRGNLSITDYLDKINNIAANLALVGKPVDDDALITLILNGVGPTYEATINSIQARDTRISLDDLVRLLLSAEIRHDEQNSQPVESNPTAL